MTFRYVAFIIVLTIVAQMGWFLYRTYLLPMLSYIDGLEDLQQQRHQQALEHIAQMERELGIAPDTTFAEYHGLRNPDGSWRTPKPR